MVWGSLKHLFEKPCTLGQRGSAFFYILLTMSRTPVRYVHTWYMLHGTYVGKERGSESMYESVRVRMY